MRLLRPSNAIAIFARPPVAGRAKTRLIPLLGAEGAAQFQAALIADAALKVEALAAQPENATAYLFLAEPRRQSKPQTSKVCASLVPPGCTLLPQRGADLGSRLDDAFRTLLGRHSSVIVIGTDSPLLAPAVLRAALRELRVCDAVLGPCPDGGYYLIGLGRRVLAMLGRRRLFNGVRWGTAFAFRDTLRNLVACDLSCSILESLDDVDRPDDLRRLARRLKHDRAPRRLAPTTWGFLRTR